MIKGYPDIWIERLSEEHAIARVQPNATAKWNTAAGRKSAARIPEIGEKVQIVPNHACPVVNLFDRFIVTKNDTVIAEWRVQGRGRLA